MYCLTSRDLALRVLLGVELCVVTLASGHSLHATVTMSRLESLRCPAGDPSCPPDEPLGEAKSLVGSGLALAVLSAVVFLARAALLHLRHFPRPVGFLYDMLMAVLWILGLARLVLAQDTTRALSNGSTVDADGVVATCWALRGVALATAAAGFYSTRLLVEMVLLFSPPSHPSDGSYRVIRAEDDTDAWVGEGEKGSAVLAAMHAPYSPVLAFFPDD